ncbi:hypothetical protein HK096_004710 [Nowakowskiella sp. JEL0078]|nr:hypothetical protein HK096_004710 [Nowakowskiella sp. JEL0078]
MNITQTHRHILVLLKSTERNRSVFHTHQHEQKPVSPSEFCKGAPTAEPAELPEPSELSQPSGPANLANPPNPAKPTTPTNLPNLPAASSCKQPEFAQSALKSLHLER